MKAYQHYSFDLWMTLIRSNPAFKESRAHYFFQHFNSQNLPLQAVKDVFRQVDKAANAINEKTGNNLDAEELCLWVIAALNDYDQAYLSQVDLQRLQSDLDELLWRFPPVLYTDDVPEVLEQISRFATLSLLSNTGFVKGAALREVLTLLGIAHYFSFQLYSDEEGISKPNKQFFDLMLDKVSDLYGTRPVLYSDIIHIGDNPIADIEGAKAAGIHACLVHQGSNTLQDLLVT